MVTTLTFCAVVAEPVNVPLNVPPVKNVAVTALPDKLPLNNPVAVTKPPVTAVPVTLPVNIPVVRVLVAASYVRSLSEDKARPEPDVALINGNLYEPDVVVTTFTFWAVVAVPVNVPVNHTAVTALPDKLPLNKVLAVTKFPVTAVPVTLPVKIPVVKVLVAAS